MEQYVIVTTLPIKLDAEKDAFFSENDRETFVCASCCAAEPQLKYFLDRYPVSKIIAIGSKEALSNSAVFKAPALPEKEKGVYSLENTQWGPESEYSENDRVLDVLLARLKKEVQRKNTDRSRDIQVQIIRSEEDMVQYWWDVFSAIRDTSPADSIQLLVDTQGGQRTDRFIQNELLSLLQAEGRVTIAQIACCVPEGNRSRILDVTEQYRNIEQLVSGMNALAQYGETDILEGYFRKKELSSAELHLLDTMREFGQAMSLSDAEAIFLKANELALCFLDCRESADDADPILGTLLDCMENAYSDFLHCPEKYRVFYIVRWCIRMGRLQQALTLFESQTTKALTDLFHVTRLPERTTGEVNWSNYILKCTRKGGHKKLQ